MSKIDYKERFKRAEKQRFVALKNCLNTLEQFATPSVSPDQFENFLKLKKELLERYKPKRIKT